jgi:divalent metal cation (Fe/Co/Zn/Cd) transporter
MSSRQAMVRRGIRLQYLTIAWNSMEALVAIISGLVAGSIARLGFGLDSVIEVSSGAVLVWFLSVDERETREHAEDLALRRAGLSFLALAAYVTYDALAAALQRESPDRSLVGFGLAILSLLVMPILARAKRSVARGRGSGVMENRFPPDRPGRLLIGDSAGRAGLKALLGWWWADRVAALGMVPLIAHEGTEAGRGNTCRRESACVEGKQVLDLTRKKMSWS